MTDLIAKAIVFCTASAVSFYLASRAERHFRRRALLKKIHADLPGPGPAPGTPARGPRALALALGRLAAPKKEEELSAVRLQLRHAGFRRPESLLLFYGIRIALGAALTLSLLLPWLGMGSFSARQATLMVFPFAAGYYLPAMVLRQKVLRRRQQIFRELPDTLDLLGICLRAGLGFDFALYRVCRELREIAPELSEEFGLFFLEIKGGLNRETALENLAERNPSGALKNVVTVLIQSARAGTDMAGALKTYTENMRTERRQKAEEQAGKLSTKLTLPLVVFILPALMLIILGPTIINFVTLVKEGF